MQAISQKRQSGFTLIEIAIVLVIIGLLLGGVLKGRSLIEGARIKNGVNQINGYAAAVMTYQDRYRFLPGDDPNAASRWSGAISVTSNGLLNTAAKRLAAFDHMNHAGLITSFENIGTTLPPHPWGGTLYLITNTAVQGTVFRLAACLTALTKEDAENLSREIDGTQDSNSGDVRRTGSGTEWAATANVACVRI